MNGLITVAEKMQALHKSKLIYADFNKLSVGGLTNSGYVINWRYTSRNRCSKKKNTCRNHILYFAYAIFKFYLYIYVYKDVNKIVYWTN